MSAIPQFLILAGLLLLAVLALLLWPRSAAADSAAPAAVPPPPPLGAAARSALALGLLGFATVAYQLLGEAAALQQPTAAPVEGGIRVQGSAAGLDVGPEQIQAMVERLAARLKTQPDDAKGWRMLARSYENLQRPEEAVQAYRELMRLTPDDADMLSDYAVTLAMSLGRQSLVGEPEALIERALAARPDHLQALALAGSVALDRGRYREAVAFWRRVQAVVPPESLLAEQVARSIAKAQTLAEAQR